MKALIRTGIATLATSVGAGLVVIGVGAADANSGADDQAFGKREDNTHEWVVVADDDDNGDDDNRLRGADTHTRTGAGKGGTHTRTRGTHHSREDSGRSGDHTRSGHTRMSRDRDHSRGDKTRDWTHDGTRDFSANLTDDRSRNDTRGR